MQPSVSVAQQLPTPLSSMPPASTTALVGAKLPSGPTGFGDALGKLLAAVAAANQPGAPRDGATAIAQATVDLPASVPTLQPGQTPSGPPVACALPPPETAIRAPSDAEAYKAPPESQPVRRGTPPRATWASVPVDQQALPTDAQLLSVPTPQTVEAPAAPRSVSIDATPALVPQDGQAATAAQTAALPAVELTPLVPAALPKTVALSAQSNLAAAMSPTHTASRPAPLAPVVVALPLRETAIRAPSDARSKARPENQPVRRGTSTRAASVSMPVDQQALPADVRPLLVETPLPDSAPERAAPAAPRQATEAPEQTEVVKAVASPQTIEVPGAPTSVSVAAAPSPPPRDAQEAAEQSAALPAVKLTPWVPAALPDAAAQSTHAASPGPPVAPVLVQIGNASEAPIQESSAAESRKAPAETRPVRRATPTRAMSVSAPVDQQALSTDVQSLLLATPPSDSKPDHVAPTALGQHAEAPEQKAVVKAASSPRTIEAPGEPTSVSVDATPSPPPQDVQAAATTQSTAHPVIELTPQVSAALPQTAAQSTPSSLSTAASASPSHAASPAAQLAPALAQMGHAPDGAQRLTVRLDPPELGHVQVRIDRPPEAAARVEITVEKPETLTLLLRDQPQLQHALDLAGVPAEGRSVTFHIASPEAVSRNSEPATAPAPGVVAGGLNNDGSHGAPRQGGQSGRQQGPAQDASESEFTPIGLTDWLRGGLDITA